VSGIDPDWKASVEVRKPEFLEKRSSGSVIGRPLSYDEAVAIDKDQAKRIARLDAINAPPHYRATNGLEAIDVIEGFGLNYRLGTAVAYILRHGKKGTATDALDDLRKCRWFIEREIAALEAVR
jgi:hypothetical protein